MIGYGSWATALVGQLSSLGHDVYWHITNLEVSDCIIDEGYNPKYVSNLSLDTSKLHISSDINEVVSNCPTVILCCPSAYLKSVLDSLSVPLADKLVISAIKGIIPDSHTTVLEYMHDTYGLSWQNLAVLSGPTHAEEVAGGRISYICAAAANEQDAQSIVKLLNGPKFRVETSDDIYGVEYAGVLKNIYAIVAGMASGLGYGDNFRAVLISAAASEMNRFLQESYPFERNVFSKAYLGDLLVTCYSEFSRNRRLGKLIGKGCSVKSALNEMTMIAEGYFSTKLIHEIKQAKGLSDLPIADFAYEVLYCGTKPRSSMASLAEKL